MKCPDKFIDYMHDFLDEEITPENEQLLKAHLLTCSDCQNHFHELEKAIALVKSTSHIQAPSDFTANVMAKLPKEQKRVGMKRWFSNHPILTAASLFIFLMGGSLVSTWNQEQEFSVTKQPNLVVENNTVLVPEGEVVKGNITVRNGTIKIEGKIEGNVTVINGEQYLASAGHVTGEIEEVNEVFEWIWYHMKNTGKEVIDIFEGENQKEE